jgi:catechol 2,3-dioxygenase-like lactoylglutathione lyase family enzyme
MFSYVTLGTNDLHRGAAFYDALLAPLGAKRLMEAERYIGWGTPGAPALLLIKPFDGSSAMPGNGVMLALHAGSRQVVDAVHKLALTLGAKDEGAVGPRGDSFYGGYFRDLDGNKLAICHLS